ncbi:MAG: hypothetical protein ACD_39C01346G0002 [uncultured bacterium]|nr:MAG: hypothetical protein ACD_39C01346G0002 [uncultured bacterium]
MISKMNTNTSQRNLRRLVIMTMVSCFMLISFELSAWDCIETHPTINALAFEHFVARFNAGHFKDRFKGMQIDNQAQFSGLTFSKAVKYEASTEAKTINTVGVFSQWLERGGHDADVPQVRMGFRHFYDPVYEPRYLTWLRRKIIKPDKNKFSNEKELFESYNYRADDWNPNIEFGTVNRKIRLQPKIFRPEIDAITWGMSHEENEHNWQNGKLAYKAAMENDTSTFGSLNRSQMFGKAFRALGETMHLMADMTQPAHTRADSHSLYEPIEGSVNAKMVRKVIGDAHKDPNFRPVPEFDIEPGLSPEELMKSVAAFTNSHFFSNDSVFDFEKWIFPRSNKRPYPSPQLSKLRHEAGIYYSYFETVGWVPLAKETGSRFSKVFNDNDKYGRKNPKFNVMPYFAEKQAQVLIPLAIYNCAELIGAFLPRLSISSSLRKISGNSYELSGSLLHHADDPEWQDIGEIRYNGEGYIKVNSQWLRCNFIDGQLKPVKLELAPGDIVKLSVRNGAVIVQGEAITAD